MVCYANMQELWAGEYCEMVYGTPTVNKYSRLERVVDKYDSLGDFSYGFLMDMGKSESIQLCLDERNRISYKDADNKVAARKIIDEYAIRLIRGNNTMSLRLLGDYISKLEWTVSNGIATVRKKPNPLDNKLSRIIHIWISLILKRNQTIKTNIELRFEETTKAIKTEMDQSHKTEDQDECAICKISIQMYDLTCMNENCIHVFHDACIKEWIQLKDDKTTCPMCREIWTNIDC